MTLVGLKGASPLLRDLGTSDLEFLESVATEKDFDAGAIVFDDDDPANDFYIVARGRIGLEVSIPAQPPVLVATLGPGELLGVSWLFPPYRWNWRARSLISSTLMAFDAVAVRGRCMRDPELALNVYRAVAGEAVRRLHATRVRLLDLYPGVAQ